MEQKTIGLLNGGESITVKSMKEQAYALIKDAILYHKLSAGEIYSQEALCTELGISRTPVREALLELQLEGFVSFCRGKGIYIIPISNKRAEEVVEARYYLEITGSRLAAERRKSEDIEAMEKTLRTMWKKVELCDAKIMYPLDRLFHEQIFVAAQNSWMHEQIVRLRDNFLRFETFSAFDELESGKQVVVEHQAILDAIKAKDPAQAEKAMRCHLDCTAKRTLTHLNESDDNDL